MHSNLFTTRAFRLLPLSVAALLVFLSSLVSADDTDIYFSGSGAQNTIPNVLFVLDASSSMANKIDVNEDGDTDDPEDISRIEALHQALNTLLTKVDNVRVGIMRMNGAASPSNGGTSLACRNTGQLNNDGETYVNGILDGTNIGNTSMSSANNSNACYLPTGGTVLFPVTDLDEPVSSITGEDNLFTITAPIAQASDDAEEEDPGRVVTSNEIMQMSVFQCDPQQTDPTRPGYIHTRTYNINPLIAGLDDNAGEFSGTVNNYWTYIGYPNLQTGFRFANVDIPAGAKVVDARLRFTSWIGYGDVNTTIHGDMSADSLGNPNRPEPFTSSNKITTRGATHTSAAVDWSGIPNVPRDVTFESPDISSIVQEIVDDANWNVPATLTTQPMSFILDGDNSTSFGYRYVYYHGLDTAKTADLEVSYCESATIVADKSWVGLRFQNVSVPQGATISSAYISFSAATPNANVGTASTQLLDIRIESSDDVSNTYSATNTVRSRPLGASVTWSGSQMAAEDPSNPLWEQGDNYKTPELKTLVQSIVNRPGWCGGNSMGFHF